MEGVQDDVQVGMGANRAYKGAYGCPPLCVSGTRVWTDIPVCLGFQPPQAEDWPFCEEGKDMIFVSDRRVVHYVADAINYQLVGE